MEYMDIALDEAKKAFMENEVPVGAVIVKNGKIIAKAHNTKIKNKSIIHHAEILSIIEAAKIIGDWRLIDCEMYVTLEPCPMCAGAIRESRIKKIYIGAISNISSNSKIINDIFNDEHSYHLVEIQYLNNNKCSEILSDFFKKKR